MNVTTEELNKLREQIVTGKAKFVSRTSNTKTVFIVKHKEIDVPVVYSSKHKSIVTALLMEYIKAG